MTPTPPPAKYLERFNAFLHAYVDNDITLISARHKGTGRPVILACLKQVVTAPPVVVGGPPQIGEQIVPIFEFIDPDLTELPYEPAKAEGLADTTPAPSVIVVPDPAELERGFSA